MWFRKKITHVHTHWIWVKSKKILCSILAVFLEAWNNVKIKEVERYKQAWKPRAPEAFRPWGLSSLYTCSELHDKDISVLSGGSSFYHPLLQFLTDPSEFPLGTKNPFLQRRQKGLSHPALKQESPTAYPQVLLNLGRRLKLQSLENSLDQNLWQWDPSTRAF